MDPVCNRSKDVARGQDSGKPPVLDHQGGAGIGLGEPLGQLTERVFGSHREELARHHVAGTQLVGC